MADYEIDFELEKEGVAAEPEAAYAVNRELNLAWKIVEETGANLFLTGKAGTGKTTFLRKLRETTAKRIVVLAPTGVAAINARGNTIHSFFQFPFSPFVPGKGFLSSDKKFFNMSRTKKRLISSLSVIVIDEISMVRPDMLDAMDSLLRRVRKSTLPFGGVQLLLIGDLRQLPPVVRDQEWSILKEHYATPYFFESHALKRAGFQTVELSVVYRQSDRAFVDILNAIREGNVSPELLESLNRRYVPGFNPGEHEGYIRLTTLNHAATVINNSRLSALPSEEFAFEAEIKGDFPESAYPAEKVLRLKKGAQVMFIKNDIGAERRFYNGLIGTVESISEEKICVRPSGEDRLVEVDRMEWENTRYTVDEDSKDMLQETVGVFSQYPLQLAWAITIHKSQGLTFDKAIIDASHSFAAGQTYVALSRCRLLDGLVLDAPVSRNAVIIDRNVNDFVESYGKNAPDAATIEVLKNRYLYSLLVELFDFETLRRSYNDFDRYVREYLVPSYPSLYYRMEEWSGKVRESLCDVGRKFVSSYSVESLAAQVADPSSTLLQRIRKGCDYFLEIILDLNRFIKSLPTDIDNSRNAERLNNTFDTLRFHTGLKGTILDIMSREDFSVGAYVAARSRAVLTVEEGNRPAKIMKSSKKPKK